MGAPTPAAVEVGTTEYEVTPVGLLGASGSQAYYVSRTFCRIAQECRYHHSPIQTSRIITRDREPGTPPLCQVHIRHSGPRHDRFRNIDHDGAATLNQLTITAKASTANPVHGVNHKTKHHASRGLPVRFEIAQHMCESTIMNFLRRL